MSPVTMALSIASASSPSWKSPATVRTFARSGSLGAKATNGDKIAIADQIRGGRGDDQIIVVFAEAASPRRRRQADKRNVGAILHPSEDFAMELMGLVDDDEIDVWPFATCDRLDAAHLDRLIAIGALVDALHDAEAVECPRLRMPRRSGRSG